MLSRAHTALAVVLVALVPLAPAALKAYAAVASVDRGEAIAANEGVLASIAHYPRARRSASHTYERRAWEGESLVPIDGYRTEAFYRLPRAIAPAEILRHYERQLAGWERLVEPVACDVLGLPAGCGALYATFRRDDVEVELELAESLVGSGGARSYGLYVSQCPCEPASK